MKYLNLISFILLVIYIFMTVTRYNKLSRRMEAIEKRNYEDTKAKYSLLTKEI